MWHQFSSELGVGFSSTSGKPASLQSGYISPDRALRHAALDAPGRPPILHGGWLRAYASIFHWRVTSALRGLNACGYSRNLEQLANRQCESTLTGARTWHNDRNSTVPWLANERRFKNIRLGSIASSRL